MAEYEPPENVVAAICRDAIEVGTTEDRMKSVLRTWLRAEVRRVNRTLSQQQVEALVP